MYRFREAALTFIWGLLGDQGLSLSLSRMLDVAWIVSMPLSSYIRAGFSVGIVPPLSLLVA